MHNIGSFVKYVMAHGSASLEVTPKKEREDSNPPLLTGSFEGEVMSGQTEHFYLAFSPIRSASLHKWLLLQKSSPATKSASSSAMNSDYI